MAGILRNTARLTNTMSYTFIDFILLMTAKTNFEILGFQNYGMQSSWIDFCKGWQYYNEYHFDSV